VQLNDQKCDDPERNALNRFMHIHKTTGDTRQDLVRDQKYGPLINDDDFDRRKLKLALNEDIADNLPSDESRRAMQALKQRAIRNADADANVASPTSTQRDDKYQTVIELHENRTKP
jgi:hypothetical protein